MREKIVSARCHYGERGGSYRAQYDRITRAQRAKAEESSVVTDQGRRKRTFIADAFGHERLLVCATPKRPLVPLSPQDISSQFAPDFAADRRMLRVVPGRD